LFMIDDSLVTSLNTRMTDQKLISLSRTYTGCHTMDRASTQAVGEATHIVVVRVPSDPLSYVKCVLDGIYRVAHKRLCHWMFK
jgi:hypothetical protein